jgi:hypothetical protein
LYREDRQAQDGQWWLPSHPESKLPGQLRQEPDGWHTLRVTGQFPKVRDEELRVVLGTTVSGDAVTMQRCRSAGATHYFVTGIEQPSFASPAVFIGAHFPLCDDIPVTGLHATLRNLHHFLNPRGLLQTVAGPEPGTLLVTATPALGIRATAKLDGRQLQVLLTEPQASLGGREVTVGRFVGLTVASEAPQPFWSLMEDLRVFQLLLGLALGMDTPVESLWIESPLAKPSQLVGDSSEPQPVFATLSGMVNAEPDRTTTRLDQLFTYPDIADHFEDALTHWFGACRKFEPVISLYNACLPDRGLSDNAEFLFLSQALEAYHRGKLGGRYVDTAAFRTGLYQTLVSSLPPNLSDDFRASLISRLRYVHEFSLRKRLASLVDALPKPAPHFISDSSRFVSDVVAWRNLLTHHDDESRAECAKAPPVRVLARYLKVLLEMALLSELGLPGDVLRALPALSECYRSPWLWTEYAVRGP